MRNIYTGVDIGSNNIKIITLEKYQNKLNVLAAVCVKSQGVKKGLITDATLCSNAIKKGLKDIESKLGTKVDKVVATIPSNNRELVLKNGKVTINEVDNTITGNDIFLCMQDAIKDVKNNMVEVVTISPVEYIVDQKKYLKSPIGMTGKELIAKVVVTTVPKKNLLSVVNVFDMINVEVVDVTFSTIGDYYAVKNDDLDRLVTIIVNIGSETTNISIFNKGIMIKNQILDIGSDKIDNDIDFVHKVNKKDLTYIKKEFAVANKKYADQDETYRLVNRFNVKIEINQYELAEIIEARIVDMLKNVKRYINNLTNKEIGYIIITGGITDMTGFDSLVDDIFVKNAIVLNMNTLGIRSNVYSSCYGIIKYLVEKLDGREKIYTMFTDAGIEEMMAPRKKVGVSNVLGKIFERFFE